MASVARKKTKSRYSVDEVSKILNLKKKDIRSFASAGIFSYADRAKKRVDTRNFRKIETAAGWKRNLGVSASGAKMILKMQTRLVRLNRDVNKMLKNMKKQLGLTVQTNLKKSKRRKKKRR